LPPGETLSVSQNPHLGPRYWIGIASRDHVRRGVEGGFLQLGHGQLAPVRRLRKGDQVVYYSPRTAFPDGDPVRAFTALGTVLDDGPEQVEQSAGFHPHRRRVRYLKTREAPIEPLLQRLALTRDRRNWGILFRRSSMEIDEADFALIRAAMTRRSAP
jgi:EVE domain